MTVQQLIQVSNLFFLLGFILLIITILISIKLDLYMAWYMLYGRKIKRYIPENKQKKRIRKMKANAERQEQDQTRKLIEFTILYDKTLIHTEERI